MTVREVGLDSMLGFQPLLHMEMYQWPPANISSLFHVGRGARPRVAITRQAHVARSVRIGYGGTYDILAAAVSQKHQESANKTTREPRLPA